MSLSGRSEAVLARLTGVQRRADEPAAGMNGRVKKKKKKKKSKTKECMRAWPAMIQGTAAFIYQAISLSLQKYLSIYLFHIPTNLSLYISSYLSISYTQLSACLSIYPSIRLAMNARACVRFPPKSSSSSLVRLISGYLGRSGKGKLHEVGCHVALCLGVMGYFPLQVRG